ncbi:nicotinate phosphoribosyltransferase, partial [Streptomyces sp. NPDC057052]
ADGIAEAEVVGTGQVPAELADHQLQVELVKGGEVVAREPLDVVRDRHAAARAGLPLSATQLSRGEPVLATEYVQGRSGS